MKFYDSYSNKLLLQKFFVLRLSVEAEKCLWIVLVVLTERYLEGRLRNTFPTYEMAFLKLWVVMEFGIDRTKIQVCGGWSSDFVDGYFHLVEPRVE